MVITAGFDLDEKIQSTRKIGDLGGVDALIILIYIYIYIFSVHLRPYNNYQRDALNIIYSSNINTLLYMFRVSSIHLQEDIVVHKQHMVPSLSIRVLVSC